jgi:type IV pilus biogenesis protein CpaD/CtpE
MKSVFDRCHKNTLLAGISALALFGLGACTEHIEGNYSKAEYRSAASEVQHDLHFQPGSPSLARGESERLGARLRELVLRSNDDILIHLSSTGSETLDLRRAASARATVSHTPARVRIIADPGYALEDRFPDVALVQVVRYGRVRVVCPQQGTDFRDDRFHRSELLMGCVNAINLAAMAAEPRDLTAPGSLSGTEFTGAVRAVENYRNGSVQEPTLALAVGD